MTNQNPGEAAAECSEPNVRNAVLALPTSPGIPFTSSVFAIILQLVWLMGDLYSETYKTLMKMTQMDKYTVFMDWKN